ncbi:hypothetical protein ACLMJK_000749 [Lecanora helva]
MPYLLDPPNNAPPRLIILPSDDDPSIPVESRGRPIDASYSSISEKLKFMHTHSITTSILSLANPWLDFLDPTEAPHWADVINNELDSLCQQHEKGRLYAFATLPLSALPETIVAQIHTMHTRPSIKGFILGTSGLGTGLDDPVLDPIYSALETTSSLIFLHPHYGLPSSVYGPRAGDYGHVLPLALGFPMETTIAFTRMFLSGVFDRFPALKILIAHAGGTVPFLAGRIESCVQHERQFTQNDDGSRGPQRSLAVVMRENVWLDAVVYAKRGIDAAVDLVGEEKVLFGTDHPFFPPLEEGKTVWESWRMNRDAVAASGDGGGRDRKIMGENAVKLLGLEGPEGH